MEHPFQTWGITTADAARRGDKSWEQWPEADSPEAEGLGQGRGNLPWKPTLETLQSSPHLSQASLLGRRAEHMRTDKRPDLLGSSLQPGSWVS